VLLSQTHIINKWQNYEKEYPAPILKYESFFPAQNGTYFINKKYAQIASQTKEIKKFNFTFPAKKTDPKYNTKWLSLQ